MKLGQALSIFEAALPEETAAPYREALTKLQEAAPPMPTPTVHRVLDEQFGRTWRDPLRVLRRRPGGRGEHRPGAPGGVGRRAPGRGQDAVPRRRAGADGRLHPALADGPAVLAAVPGPRGQAAARGTQGSGGARSSTTGSRPTRSAPSPLPTPMTTRSRCRAWSRAHRRSIVSEWMDGTPLSRDHRATATRLSATAPVLCSRRCTTRRPLGPACCMPIRTRATSACSPTAGSASSISARSHGCLPATPSRSAA